MLNNLLVNSHLLYLLIYPDKIHSQYDKFNLQIDLVTMNSEQT